MAAVRANIPFRCAFPTPFSTRCTRVKSSHCLHCRVMIFAGFAMASRWSFAGVRLSMWAPSRLAGERISPRAIPVPARPTTIASSVTVSQMRLMSFLLLQSLALPLPVARSDTQKSILYACPGSPKSHRVSHCGKSESERQEGRLMHLFVPAPFRCATHCRHAC